MVKSFPVKPDLNNTAIHYILVLSIQGFPVAQMVKNLPAIQETLVQSLGWVDPLEKETTNHSSTLAWEIPWTENPRRLQSMELQRVRHD